MPSASIARAKKTGNEANSPEEQPPPPPPPPLVPPAPSAAPTMIEKLNVVTPPEPSLAERAMVCVTPPMVNCPEVGLRM